MGKNILLALARLPEQLSADQKQRALNIAKLLGIRFTKTSYNLIFPGSSDVLAEVTARTFIAELGDSIRTNQLVTYIPRKPFEKEYDHGLEYIALGTTQILDDYPHQRRERMVRNSDLVILMCGSRGTSQNASLAQTYGKPIVAIPQFGGVAQQEYSRIIDELEHSNDRDQLRLMRKIGDYSLSDEEIADAVLEVIDWILHEAKTKSVFVAMPFDAEYDEGPDVEDAIRETVSEMLSWKVELAREIEIGSNLTLTEIIPMQISRSSIIIVDLHGNRPNVYYEAGIAHGLKLPTIFIAKYGDKVHFDLASHERLVWKNIRELKQQLGKWLVEAAKRC